MNNINYKKEYIQSVLAYISYANMDGSKDGENNWANLIGVNLILQANNQLFLNNFKNYLVEKNKKKPRQGLSEYNDSIYHLAFFSANFIILDQIVNRNIDGFSVTTYQLKNDIAGTEFKAGQVFVSYRGTEPGVADFWTDAQLAFGYKAQTGPTQTFLNKYILNNESQELQAQNYLKNIIEQHGNVYINGHSLGGYLAARTFYMLDDVYYEVGGTASYKYSEKILGVSTFNGAGFGIWDGFINKKPSLVSKINNLYSVRGISFTASNIHEIGKGTIVSFFDHLGPRFPITTENAGGIENHNMSLLVNTISFLSVLEGLAINLNDSVKDSDGNLLTGNDAAMYSLNRLILKSVSREQDFGSALSKIAFDIITGLGIKINIDPNIDQNTPIDKYTSIISQFMSLGSFFEANPSYKIKLINDISFNESESDSNYNRSLMYALLESNPYQLIVPENFDKGIFDRTNKNMADYKLYNIENYTKEYLIYRKLFNKVYMYVLENKLLDSLPNSLEYDLKLKDGTNAKYIFIEQEISGGNSNVQKKIYVNTNKNEVDNNDVQTVYFKKAHLQQLNVYYKNSIVFDTPLNDSITVFDNNNLIHLMAGYDNVTLNNNTEGNIIFIEEKLKEVNINSNISSPAVTIKSKTLNLNQIEVIIKEFYSDSSGPKLFKSFLRFGDQRIYVSGKFNIAAKDTTIDYEIIQQTIKYFPENFNNAESNTIIFDESFLEKYIERTKAQFGVLTYELEKIPTNRLFSSSVESEIKLSQQHSDYILQKINAYSSVLNSLGFTFDASIFNSYITDKVLTVDLDQTILPTSVNNLIMNRINQPQITIPEAIKVLINEKLQSFSADKYSNIIDMSNMANFDTGKVDNIYLKKETKGYEYITDNNGIVHSKWDGKYYYNKIKNNVQVSTYKYGSTNDNSYNEGKLMYYYNNGIYIDLSKLVSNPEIEWKRLAYPVSGSDGSDILVGKLVYGQSDNYGAYENATFIPANSNINGNDILVADILASVNSGNNLLISDVCVYGGKGNDFIIFTGNINHDGYTDSETKDFKYLNDFGVYINHNAKNSEEENNKNYVLSLGGPIYSSKATNFVIDLSIRDSQIPIMYATGKDTFFGGPWNSVFIGGYEAYQLAEDQQTPEADNFYTKHQINTSKNFVYGGSGNITAYLSQNDFGDFTAGKATVAGLGGNEVILNNDSMFISGGNSTITIRGKNNHIFLAEGDTYNVESLFENNIYPAGFREQANTEISMTVKGALNKINLSKATYNLTLEGVNSSILFTEPNNNLQIINSNEVGETKITFNNNKKVNLITNNKAIVTGSVEDLELTYNNDLELYLNSKKVKIDTDSTLGDNNNNLFVNGTIEDLTINNTSDYNTTTFNGSIEKLFIKKSILSGEIRNSQSLNMSGVVTGLKHTGKQNSVNNEVNISGLITDNSLFKNISIFNYQEIENNGYQSSFTLENSHADDLTKNIYNSKIVVKDSTVNNILLNGSDYNISLENTPLDNFKIENLDTLYFETNNHINLFQVDLDLIKIVSFGVSDLKVSYVRDREYPRFEIIASNIQSIKVSTPENITVGITATTIQELILESGNISISSENLGYINIDIDKIKLNGLSSFNSFDMTSSKEIKISAKGDNNLYLNDKTLEKLPNNFTVSGKIYTKADLELIVSKVKYINDSYAICNGTEIIYTGLPVEPEVPENPTEPYYDSEGFYNGTKGDDIFTLNENKEYKLRGRGGNDTYNFIGQNNYSNTLEYSSTDGLATLNTSSFTRITIVLKDIEKDILNYIATKDTYGNVSSLNVYNGSNLILTINNYQNVMFTLWTTNGIIGKDNIAEILLAMYGTDGDDIIEANNQQGNYIYPKKGNDVININAGYDNKIYYFLNDGFKTINSTGNSYTVILNASMSKNNISYTLSTDNIISVLYSGEKILTLNQATVSILTFLSTGEQITGQSIINEFTTIRGTSGNDIIEALAGYSVYTGAGDDIVNVNYLATDKESTVFYEIGDGYDRIILSNVENNQVTIKFPTSMIKSNVKFEYDKNNHNNLNIYYRQSAFLLYQKIMTVENYNYLSTGRANIYLGYTGLSYYFDINPQAEQNYQIALGQPL